MHSITTYYTEKELTTSHCRHFSKNSKSPLKIYLQRFDYDISSAVVVKEVEEEFRQVYTVLLTDVVLEIPLLKSGAIEEFDVVHTPIQVYFDKSNRQLQGVIKLAQSLFRRDFISSSKEYRITIISRIYYAILLSVSLLMLITYCSIISYGKDVTLDGFKEWMVAILGGPVLLFASYLFMFEFLNWKPKIITNEDKITYYHAIRGRCEILWKDVLNVALKRNSYRGVNVSALEFLLKNGTKKAIAIQDISESIEHDVNERIKLWKNKHR